MDKEERGVRSLATSRIAFDQDYVIDHVRQFFPCTVLWCEGRPCLEYDSQEQLDKIAGYVKEKFDRELLDVFFSTIESLPPE